MIFLTFTNTSALTFRRYFGRQLQHAHPRPINVLYTRCRCVSLYLWRNVVKNHSRAKYNKSRLLVNIPVNGLAPRGMRNLSFNQRITRNPNCNSTTFRYTATDLKIQKTYSTNGKKSFPVRGAKLWNSLLNNVDKSGINCFCLLS